jgi:hypothetical protein
LSKVGRGRTIAEYSKKEVVFSQGDPGDAIFYIQKGKVKLTVVSNTSKEAVSAILGAGDFLGEGCLRGRYVSGYGHDHVGLLDLTAGETGHDPRAARIVLLLLSGVRNQPQLECNGFLWGKLDLFEPTPAARASGENARPQPPWASCSLKSAISWEHASFSGRC